MSRVYDAKTAALAAYPNRCQDGVDLMLGYLEISESDFKYDMCCTPEEYLYGKERQTDE